MLVDWTLAQTLGYIDTWSAVAALKRSSGEAPVKQFHRELTAAWGNAPSRRVRWPLTLKVGRLA